MKKQRDLNWLRISWIKKPIYFELGLCEWIYYSMWSWGLRQLWYNIRKWIRNKK